MDVEGGVIEAIRNVSRRPIQPTLTSDLIADLGFDSFQVLELIAELEDRFDISIQPDDAPVARTVADVVGRVSELLQK
jgi:acyl carrier protein